MPEERWQDGSTLIPVPASVMARFTLCWPGERNELLGKRNELLRGPQPPLCTLRSHPWERASTIQPPALHQAEWNVRTRECVTS